MSKMSFNPMRFIADNAGLNIFEAIDKAYEQGIADERERIIAELEEQLKDEILGDGKSVSDVGIGLEIALKIVRGGE